MDSLIRDRECFFAPRNLMRPSSDQACTFSQLALVSTGALLAPYSSYPELIDHTPGPLSQEPAREETGNHYFIAWESITGWDPSRNNLSSACITKPSRQHGASWRYGA